MAALLSAAKVGVQPPAVTVAGRFAHLPVRLGRLPFLSPALVRRAHRLGVRVVVWTVDEPAAMHELLDMGVDGIITDRPDVLRSVLIGRGAWTPMRADSSSRGVGNRPHTAGAGPSGRPGQADLAAGGSVI